MLTAVSTLRAGDVEWRDVVDTPAVVIDLDIVEQNLTRVADRMRAAGLAFRPHIKTHKIPLLAKAQMELGAVGITAQKISEAEVMADAGIADILISFNIVGTAKLERLVALHNRTHLRTVADSAAIVEGLARHFTDPKHPLGVLVEIDGYMNRCGAVSVADAMAVVARVVAAAGLRFDGFMTYPAPDRWQDALDFLKACAAQCHRAGIAAPILSTGGTPDLEAFVPDGQVTEYRAGSYIYNDRSLIARGAVAPEACALTVFTTVISHPEPGRAVVDAGSKSLTSDLSGLQGYGAIKDLPTARIAALSEEHGHILLGPEDKVQIGQRLQIIPNHCCPVSNLVDSVTFVRGRYLVGEQPVLARGTTR